jgi:LPXTG-motif cell wall-anchored protein
VSALDFSFLLILLFMNNSLTSFFRLSCPLFFLQTSTITVENSAAGGSSAAIVPASTATQIMTVSASTSLFVTTTDASGKTVTSAPPEGMFPLPPLPSSRLSPADYPPHFSPGSVFSLYNLLSSPVTSIVTSTDAAGARYTVTQVVKNPGSLSNAAGGGSGSGFFNNTGAVVGVFVVVGIAGAAMLLAFGFFFVRRRRAARLGASPFPLSLCLFGIRLSIAIS